MLRLFDVAAREELLLALEELQLAVTTLPLLRGQVEMETVKLTGARLNLETDMGQLEAGTVLTGRLLFGKERVYGRFTEAQRPSGETYRVCMEAWSAWEGVPIRGLVPKPNAGPDTAEVIAGPDVRAVERFE